MRPWPFNAGGNVAAQLAELSKRTADRTATFPAGAVAPNVDGASVWRTNNAAATNVTGFAGGYETARVVVIAGDAHTTLVHSAALYMKGRANVALAVGDTREFVATADPATRRLNWYEV